MSNPRPEPALHSCGCALGFHTDLLCPARKPIDTSTPGVCQTDNKHDKHAREQQLRTPEIDMRRLAQLADHECITIQELTGPELRADLERILGLAPGSSQGAL